jgi:hypothetical protein
MSDVTKTGDSFYTNELVDNVLVSRDGFCNAVTVVYANGHDLKDPLLSPVYGDMHGFPPATLTTRAESRRRGYGESPGKSRLCHQDQITSSGAPFGYGLTEFDRGLDDVIQCGCVLRG